MLKRNSRGSGQVVCIDRDLPLIMIMCNSVVLFVRVGGCRIDFVPNRKCSYRDCRIDGFLGWEPHVGAKEAYKLFYMVNFGRSGYST